MRSRQEDFRLPPLGKWTCWVCSRHKDQDVENDDLTLSRDHETRCSCKYHKHNVSQFLNGTAEHTQRERCLTFCWGLAPRMIKLVFKEDQDEVKPLLDGYFESKETLKSVMARLDWFEYTGRSALSMLAAWKHLAKSRADEDPVDVSHVKTGRMLQDTWMEHRNDWKLHKQQVFDSGHVHLVGMLVRPFLEVVDTFKLLTD
jgi:hypothetical protein